MPVPGREPFNDGATQLQMAQMPGLAVPTGSSIRTRRKPGYTPLEHYKP